MTIEEKSPSALPLTICLVSPISAAANGGTAAYIRELGNRLVQHQHRVVGVSRFHTDTRKNLRFDQSDENPQLKIPFRGWDTSLISPRKGHAILLRQLLSLMTRPPLHSLAIGIYNAAFQSALASAVPAETDFIHFIGTGWEMLGFTALQTARRKQIPFIVTPFVHPTHWGDSPLDIRLYNQSDLVFVCTDFERNHLIAKGVRPEILQKTDLGSANQVKGQATRFRVRYQLGNRPIILFIGRKKRNKGYHVLREATSLIAREIPDMCLVVAGSEGELPYPPVPDFNLLDLGIIDEQNKADAFAACDVFAMPSLGEAFGIVYAEAWEYAKPVVGGMAPALAEIIEEGVTGYRVEQKPDILAETLLRLLRDTALRERLGKAGQTLQQNRFTWDSTLLTHETNYLRLSKSRNR